MRGYILIALSAAGFGLMPVLAVYAYRDDGARRGPVGHTIRSQRTDFRALDGGQPGRPSRAVSIWSPTPENRRRAAWAG